MPTSLDPVDLMEGESQLVAEVLRRPVVLTPRIRRIKESFFADSTHIVADRVRLATLSWKETEGEHLYVRRAKLFAKICNEIPIAIHPDELIVGSQTRYLRGCGPQLDWSPVTGEEIVQGSLLTSTESVKADLDPGDLKLIQEDTEYWKGRSPFEQVRSHLRQKFGEDLEKAGYLARSMILTRSADYNKVLTVGLRGISDEARAELASPDLAQPQNTTKARFLEAAVIALEGMIGLARRYAQLAMELAESEKDPGRKRELEAIGEACKWVPENPARSFFEAVQSLRLAQLGVNLETDSSHEVIGRLDQYLYPFLAKDIRETKLTVEQAGELLANFFLKIHEMGTIKAGTHRKTSESNYGAQITIGGVDREGRDAVNPVSYLILEVVRQLKLSQPSVFARIHSGTPDEFIIRGLEANREVGGGIPAFMNDDRIIPNLLEDGVPVEDARDWACFGCVEPYIPHSSGQYDVSVHVNGAKLLELVMHNGWDPVSKTQLGPKTGDPRDFRGVDDWVAAWKAQFEYSYNLQREVTCAAWHERSKVYALPFNSALMNDCIQKGRDVLGGGLRYLQLGMVVSTRVYANVADALMAIKKIVYDEKRATVDEIIQACAQNFEGTEDLRQRLLAAPKFGNDTDEVDDLMRDISVWSSRLVRSGQDPYGYPMRDTRSGATVHVADGLVVGALPDGRRAWEPLADGGISPMRGCDKNGPTAVLASVTKAIDIHSNRSAVLNQKLSPALVNTRDNTMKVVYMMRTFFEDNKGYQIQYNIHNRETLLAARAHPEQYRDLVVRAGGYSAYFVELTPQMQDDIILRTEQTI